jgi:hypothetical protein
MIPVLPRTKVTGTFTPLTIMMFVDNTRADKETTFLRKNGIPSGVKLKDHNRLGND